MGFDIVGRVLVNGLCIWVDCYLLIICGYMVNEFEIIIVDIFFVVKKFMFVKFYLLLLYFFLEYFIDDVVDGNNLDLVCFFKLLVF